MGISQDLDLNVAWADQQPFEQHGRVTKGCQRLPLRSSQRQTELLALVDCTHALPTTPCARLD